MKKFFILFLFSLLLVSCSDVLEKEQNVFFSSRPYVQSNISSKCYIHMSFSGFDTLAYVKASSGLIGSQTEYSDDYSVFEADSGFTWINDGYDDEVIYIEVIFKDDGYIVGYGLLEAVLFYENEMPFGYNLSVLRSIVFPKVNNKHQNISEEYVLMQFEKYKN